MSSPNTYCGKAQSQGPTADPHHPRDVVATILRYTLLLQRVFRCWHGNLARMIELCEAMEQLPGRIATIPCRDRHARRLVARQTAHWRRDRMEVARIRLGMQYHALARQGVDPVKLITARFLLAVTVAQLAVLDWIRPSTVLPDDRRRVTHHEDDPVPEGPDHGVPEARGPPPKDHLDHYQDHAGSTPPAILPTWILLNSVLRRVLARLGGAR